MERHDYLRPEGVCHINDDHHILNESINNKVFPPGASVMVGEAMLMIMV